MALGAEGSSAQNVSWVQVSVVMYKIGLSVTQVATDCASAVEENLIVHFKA